MQTVTKQKSKLLRMSRIAPSNSSNEMDSVAFRSHSFGSRRAFDILMEAQQFWNQMDQFRKDRQRNKRYTYGDQWGDDRRRIH